MKEVKTPKKPLAIYYAIVLLVLMLLNFVLVLYNSFFLFVLLRIFLLLPLNNYILKMEL